MSDTRPRLRDARARASRSRGAVSTRTFTVIHAGAEITQEVALELVEEVSVWAFEEDPGLLSPVDVWAAPWSRMSASCVATVVAFGGPLSAAFLPRTDDLVAQIEAIGINVRHRRARPEKVIGAELRAVSLGWPVRYI